MTAITVIDRDGLSRNVKCAPAHSLMELLRGEGFDQILAQCGGSCACGTCHVYLDIADKSRLPPLSRDEDELLGASDHRAPNSRLSCQIRITPALDGARVTIAPED